MQKWKAILLVAAILVQSFYCPVMAREARFLETAAPVLDLSSKISSSYGTGKQGNLICER